MVAKRRWLLPLAAFLLVMVVQALYVRHESRVPVSGWAANSAIVDNGLWGFRPYIESRDYLTGYSYALPLAFAVVALRRYRDRRKHRRSAARNAAIGGITLSGILAGSGCFLLGCCGSPMLGIYLSFFGAAFLPMVKPLVAGVTTMMVGVSYYWWIWRPNQNHAKPANEVCCQCEDRLDLCNGETAQSERDLVKRQLQQGHEEADTIKALNQKYGGLKS